MNIECHNLVPEPLGPGEGLLLPRYPRAVREAMESPGFLTAQESTGGELRFFTAALHLRVFLLALNQDVEVAVFKGDFQHSTHLLQQGRLQCIHLSPPERFREVAPEILARGNFHPELWRVVLDRGAVVLRHLETFGQELRPPDRNDKPRLRWLAYGSSITHSTRNGYAHQAARRLGVDVLNKGLSGSCYIEEAAAEFLAADCEWDFATLELGINMRSQFTPEEFERRARHLVRRCVEAKPGRPVFLISIFPNFSNYRPEPDQPAVTQAAFDRILRQIAEEYEGREVRLIEGASILRNFSSLSADLLHPTDFGHVLMGENLAEALRPFLPAKSYS